MLVHSRVDIERALADLDLVELMAGAFAAYSAGRAVVAPVVELPLEGGDVHIKSGYLRGDAYYVIKVASGFYANPAVGLPSSNGLMLLFGQSNGVPVALLEDEGTLTDLRTAAAGAVAARALAAPTIDAIGIFGTGTQARLQLELLREVTPCRRAMVWGRSDARLESYAHDARRLGFDVETSLDATAVASNCRLLVTTTPSERPLFPASAVRPGTHITAIGSDTPLKQELDADLLGRADRVVADSKAQCLERGEVYQALQAGTLHADEVLELGSVISGESTGRSHPDQITIADLTGVAVQDVEIARAVHEGLAAR